MILVYGEKKQAGKIDGTGKGKKKFLDLGLGER